MRDGDFGELIHDDIFKCIATAPISVPLLGGKACRFVFEGVENPPVPTDMRLAVRRLLEAPESVLRDAEPHVIRYCEEMCSLYPPNEGPDVILRGPGDVWSHVHFGDEFQVSRRSKGDDEDGVYLSMECNCDWEVEHGLQLVFREGLAVSKVSPYDGHLTNSDAYDEPSLAHVVYRPLE